MESILSASHEESGDSQPAAITLILSGPRKLSRDRITTSQPTLNTNPKWRTFWTMAKRGKSIQEYSRDIHKLHSFLPYFAALLSVILFLEIYALEQAVKTSEYLATHILEILYF